MEYQSSIPIIMAVIRFVEYVTDSVSIWLESSLVVIEIFSNKLIKRKTFVKGIKHEICV